MASLNLDSLFTNVPLNETIEIYANELFKSSQTVSSLNKQQVFRDFVNYQIKVFLFDLKYYSQIDGIAMGSPLGPTLANIFYVITKLRGLRTVQKPSNQCIIKRYVDDIFVSFENP